MDGRAVAPAAGTVVNALATGRGAAFAIDLAVEARVDLDGSGEVRGEATAPAVTEDGDLETVAVDPTLVETCVRQTLSWVGADDGGATVETESEVPVAAGLKSSSAAANAAVLATLSALDEDRPRVEACRVGVEAAREAGVTVTGAFDDASASMLGGVTVTDNRADELLGREPFERAALVWAPPRQAYSADADVEACRRVGPVAAHAHDLALSGTYGLAMTVNGLAYSPALGYDQSPALAAMPDAEGVSLSGTGPAVVAVGDPSSLGRVRTDWADRPGRTWLTETRTTGATVEATDEEGSA
jgi:shikimate kinase